MLIIYALTKGYLDDIPVEDITRFEDELNSWSKSNASELLGEIRETGNLPMMLNLNQLLMNLRKVLASLNN